MTVPGFKAKYNNRRNSLNLMPKMMRRKFSPTKNQSPTVRPASVAAKNRAKSESTIDSTPEEDVSLTSISEPTVIKARKVISFQNSTAPPPKIRVKVRRVSTLHKDVDSSSSIKLRVRSKPRHKKQIIHVFLPEALDYLTKQNGYKQEGIFRQCGDYSLIKQAQLDVEKGNANKEELLSSLGIFGVADLVKTIMRSCPRSLIRQQKYSILAQIPDLLKSVSVDENLTVNCLSALFVNAVLCSLAKKDQDVVFAILEFLRLVIVNEETSKMGSHNISIIFAGILFEPIETFDYNVFMEENAKQAKVLEIMLNCFVSSYDLFSTHPNLGIIYYYSKHSGMLDNQYILKGEEFITFHRAEEFHFGVFRKQFHKITNEHLFDAFSKENPSVSELTPLCLTTGEELDGLAKTTKKRKSLRKRLSLRRKSLGINQMKLLSPRNGDETEMQETLDKLRAGLQ